MPILLAQAANSASQVSNTVKEQSELIAGFFNFATIATKAAASIVIIIVFYILGKLIANRIVRSLKEAKGETLYPDMIALVNRFALYGSLFVGIALVLQFIFELDFLQMIGFFGLGISFAFKDLLENLIAGAVIIIQNRFHIGDFVQVGTGKALKGKIMEIQTRATILKAVDGTEIIVPNSELMMNPVISFTAHHTRRISFDIHIDFDADLKKAIKIAEQVMSKKEHVLKKPHPYVLVSKIGGSTIDLNMRFYVDPQNKEKSWLHTKSELIAEIKEAFENEGILIPYPLYSYLETKRELKKIPEKPTNEGAAPQIGLNPETAT